jgi:hypothetical protein
MKYTAKDASLKEDRTIGTSNINIPKTNRRNVDCGMWNVTHEVVGSHSTASGSSPACPRVLRNLVAKM